MEDPPAAVAAAAAAVAAAAAMAMGMDTGTEPTFAPAAALRRAVAWRRAQASRGLLRKRARRSALQMALRRSVSSALR